MSKTPLGFNLNNTYIPEDIRLFDPKPNQTILIYYDMDDVDFDMLRGVHKAVAYGFPDNRVVSLPMPQVQVDMVDKEVAIREIFYQLQDFCQDDYAQTLLGELFRIRAAVPEVDDYENIL